MAASNIISIKPLQFSLFSKPTPKTHLSIPHFTPIKPFSSLHNPTSNLPHFHLYPHFPSPLLLPRASPTANPQTPSNDPEFPTFDLSPKQPQPLKTALWVLFWASLSLAVFAFSKDSKASVAAHNSIKASNFGVKIASALRKSGWPDGAVVFALATLPVIELRGAIPVGYWMQLHPVALTLLSVLGNMLPVPFIILYLKKLATFLAGKNKSASRFLDMLFERAKEKAGPIEEFQWLGLMLFVAVPFPGTGAWTGAIIASVLDMPFWPAVSANFFGVVLAGLIVNFLVNLGHKYAVITGVILFFVSTFMWNVLRSLRKSFASSN